MNAEKIKNYLYYNWLKIAAVVFAVVFIAVTFMQCSQNPTSDFGVMYVGTENVSQKLDKLAEKLKNEADISDADNDGKINTSSKGIIIPSSKEDMIQYQIPEQIQVEIISGENRLYIFDKSTLLSYAVDESFADISDLAEIGSVDIESCLSYEDGRIYAIPVSNNSVLKECGIKGEGMYFARRNCAPKEKNSIHNKNVKKALRYLIERNASHEN